MMKNSVLILLIALIMAALGFGVYKARQILNHSETITLTDFSLPDVSGQTHAISEWQGKLRVINFWATWCPPCREELPAFVELQKQYASKNVQFLGIAIDQAEPVAKFLKQMEMNYPMLIAEEAGIELAFNLGNYAGAIPFTIIVKGNNVVFRHSGEITKAQLQSEIDKALSQ